MKLNKDISNYFIADAQEYLKRYKLLSKYSNNLVDRSKLLVDLMFALECILKSILFSESTESEKETYSKIFGHNIDKLYNLLSTSSKEEYKNCIKNSINKYHIKIRYHIESQIDFRNEQGVLSKEYYATIANPSWLENIYKQISCLFKYAEKLNPVIFETINMSDIDVELELKKVKILREIRQKAPNKV